MDSGLSRVGCSVFLYCLLVRTGRVIGVLGTATVHWNTGLSTRGSRAVRSTVRCNVQLGRLSRQWKLKSSSDDTGYGQVFVKFFPSQGISSYLNLNFFKLVFRGLTKNPKTVSGKTNDSSVRQFKVDDPLFCPSSDSYRFCFSDCGIHGICRLKLVCFQIQAVQFLVNHAGVHPDCEPKRQAQAKTCIHHRDRVHGRVEVRYLHRSKNESESFRFLKWLAFLSQQLI
jgi:hypothetical protein